MPSPPLTPKEELKGTEVNSHWKHLDLSPQTGLEMSWGLPKDTQFSPLKKHVWRCLNFPGKMSGFGLHKHSWRWPNFAQRKSTSFSQTRLEMSHGPLKKKTEFVATNTARYYPEFSLKISSGAKLYKCWNAVVLREKYPVASHLQMPKHRHKVLFPIWKPRSPETYQCPDAKIR